MEYTCYQCKKGIKPKETIQVYTNARIPVFICVACDKALDESKTE